MQSAVAGQAYLRIALTNHIAMTKLELYMPTYAGGGRGTGLSAHSTNYHIALTKLRFAYLTWHSNN